MDGAISELGLEKADLEMLVEELQSYLDTSTPDLKDSIQSAQPERIKAKSHSMKGALLNLRFKAAAELALELERHASDYSKEKGLETFERLCATLSDSFKEAASYFG